MQPYDSMHGRATEELIFTGGQIHAVNATIDIVEAVAVGGGRILALGCTLTSRSRRSWDT